MIYMRFFYENKVAVQSLKLSILDELVSNDRERRHGTGGGAPDLVSGVSLHNIQLPVRK